MQEEYGIYVAGLLVGFLTAVFIGFRSLQEEEHEKDGEEVMYPESEAYFIVLISFVLLTMYLEVWRS